VSVVTGNATMAAKVGDDLAESLTFIDDRLWCDRTAATLDLALLDLDTLSAGQSASVRLNVRGINDPLYDPRIPQLVVAVRQYRSADAVALYSQDHAWRLVIATGKPAAYLPGLDTDLIDSMPLTTGIIESLSAAHGVIADLFPVHTEVV
jgi:hypothetical protein